MASAYRSYTLIEVLERLNLPLTNGNYTICPNCGRKKAHIKIEDNEWRCPACGASGGVLRFFAASYLGYNYKFADSEFKKIGRELRKFMDGYSPSPQVIERHKASESAAVIDIADDDTLNTVFSLFYEIPELQLSPEHRQSLLRRGLDDDTIQRNGYLSVTEFFSPEYRQLYNDLGGNRLRRKILWWVSSPAYIQLGLLIGDFIVNRGINPKGIPGFFRFGNRWCFYIESTGIMVPTRNMDGQIVIWQIRRDHITEKDSTRYKTMSYRNLPDHVTAPVSRCHFPLGNAKLGTAPVVLTEGPLKSDVAVFLSDSPVTFFGIPGITTTADFLSYCDKFHALGITEVINALDMDRLTNPNVRTGSIAMRNKLKEKNLSFIDRFWGRGYAISKLAYYDLIAHSKCIPIDYPPNSSIFEKLDKVAFTLMTNGVNPSIIYNKKYFWEPETKGIDDFLLTLKNTNVF